MSLKNLVNKPHFGGKSPKSVFTCLFQIKDTIDFDKIFVINTSRPCGSSKVEDL